MHLVGCLYYLYQWCTVKQISDNEIYLLIKYIKSVLWRVAKRLSYIEDARCLKDNKSKLSHPVGLTCHFISMMNSHVNIKFKWEPSFIALSTHSFQIPHPASSHAVPFICFLEHHSIYSPSPQKNFNYRCTVNAISLILLLKYFDVQWRGQTHCWNDS